MWGLRTSPGQGTSGLACRRSQKERKPEPSLTSWPAEVLSHADSTMAVPTPSPAPFALALQQGGLEAPTAQVQPALRPQPELYPAAVAGQVHPL